MIDLRSEISVRFVDSRRCTNTGTFPSCSRTRRSSRCRWYANIRRYLGGRKKSSEEWKWWSGREQTMNFRLNLINNIIIHYYWRFYRLGFSTRNNIITEKKRIPLQERLLGASSWPGGHSQRKLPGVLMHLPPRHRPGMRAHSSISFPRKRRENSKWNEDFFLLVGDGCLDFLPMQTCIIMVLSKPSSQSQAKLPLVFWHVPLPHTPRMILHSSISTCKQMVKYCFLNSYFIQFLFNMYVREKRTISFYLDDRWIVPELKNDVGNFGTEDSWLPWHLMPSSSRA